MKRARYMIVIVIILSFFLTTYLTGCTDTYEFSNTRKASSSKASSNNTGPSGGAVKKIVSVWAVDGDYVRRADKKCNELIKDEIDVRMNYIPNIQYESKLKVAMSSGELPDVIGVDSPNVSAYAESGAIVPLDDVWAVSDREDIIYAVRQGWTYKGQIWGAQHEETNSVLFYNRDMLEAAGLKPADKIEDAWTWEETVEAAKKLTRKDANGETIVYGILPLMAGPNIAHEGQSYVSNTWTWQAGAEIMNPEGTSVEGYFNSEKNLNALKLFRRMFVIDKSAPMTEIPNGFQTGKIAMWITGPWIISTLKTVPDFNWGAMPLPKGERLASNSGGWGYSITYKAADKAAAMKVILAKTGKEGQLIDIIEGGALPNRKSLLDKAPFLKEYPYPMILEQLEKTAKVRPITAAYPDISMSIQKCFNDVAYGKDPLEAMEEYSAQMNDALKRINSK
jgi:ABC-type glycerol-3-phosphate transport system substrate-binding protein